jgi:uncharacterized protein
MKPKKLISLFTMLIGGAVIVSAFGLIARQTTSHFINPIASLAPTPTPVPRPLLAYTFTNLRQQPAFGTQIKLEQVLTDEPQFTAHVFSYLTDGKKMTGQINLPKTNPPPGGFPVILMLRGFADASTYQTGVGTKNAAAVFARNGYITIAPDFLGYGGSDPADPDSLAARVARPRNMLNLIASLTSLPNADLDRLGIWAHSNGGQIALSLLEITGKPFPTTLWAPVSKPFPYSILYFTDDYSDQGKYLRRIIADFEALYDVYDFSIDRYWDWINAPILLHQGSADDAVPERWSAQLTQTLKALEKDITYHRYEGTDHQLRPAWNTVIQRDLAFFARHL